MSTSNYEVNAVGYLDSLFSGFVSWRAEKQALVSSLDPAIRALVHASDARPRPFINHVVRARHVGDNEACAFHARATAAVGVNGCAFAFPSSECVVADLLSDSGYAAMFTKQWAAMMDGDEAYGSNDAWFEYNKVIADTFGPRFANPGLGLHCTTSLNEAYKGRKQFNFVVHQGRAAEKILFRSIMSTIALQHGQAAAGEWHIMFNNAFDTTAGHILSLSDCEFPDKDGKMVSMHLRLHNFPNPKIANGTYGPSDRFLGDGNEAEMIKFLETHHKRTIACYLTIVNNSGGSQPVSLRHIKAVADAAHEHGVPVFLDACRFAENAYFIQRDEPGYGNHTLRDITHETFSVADGFHSSNKKDGVVNMGGSLCIAAEGLFAHLYAGKPECPSMPCILQEITNSVILNEGHYTYGGLNGRDIAAMNEGLRMVLSKPYLENRVGQVERFGRVLADLGVPIVQPTGGSAVYVDVDRFFDDTDKKRRGEFLGNSLVYILLAWGIRGCELGAQAFSGEAGNAPYSDPKDVPGNFVRLAVGRNIFSDDDLYHVAFVLAYLHDKRDLIRPVVALPGCRSIPLHHFSAMFKFTGLQGN